MDRTQESCRSFIAALSSQAPTPGGGGAAALMGAIGASLGNMMANLTVGKEKYADAQEEIADLIRRCTVVQNALLDLVQQDADGYEPVARAYKLPKEDPARPDILEDAAIGACEAPLAVLEQCRAALACIDRISRLGNRLALADAGCGAICCKAAMQSASLNVLTNTQTLRNRTLASELNEKAQRILEESCGLADAVYERVRTSLLE